MHADPRTIGQHIAALRRGNGWSQRHLADAAGVSHGYIGLLERGQLPNPSKRRLDAIARALQLRTADALLNGPLDADWDVDLADGGGYVGDVGHIGDQGDRRNAGSARTAGSARNVRNFGQLGNVAGTLDQVRPSGA